MNNVSYAEETNAYIVTIMKLASLQVVTFPGRLVLSSVTSH